MTLENSMHSMPIDANIISNHACAVRETMGIYITQNDLTVLKNEGRK